MNNVSKEVIDRIITEIIEEGTSIKYQKTGKNRQEELHGFYLEPKYKNMTNVQIEALPQMKRLFVNLRAKAGKFFGSTNQSDWENNWCEVLMYLYEVFYSVFSGKANVGENLQVNSEEDIYRIINTEELAKELCSYSITYVEMKVQTKIKQRSNADYYYDSKNGYERIDYLYLNDYNGEEGEVDPFEFIAYQEEVEKETGELTKYILDNYFDKLTKKQQLFVKTYVWFDRDPQGNISMEDNTILYSKQLVHNYRKSIAKRLIKLVNEDPNIYENTQGRFVLKRGEE